eukprot:TRINITY_DN95692_c0_g1_i1.p1 TRINITY_DN95692_c0_g1~~TRINITY_DN95692_c0_g1_i1.p1  ORF type:complete len:438 (-),score=77.96 TRINITY_DN95692_c0_g1_i1:22-1335(-)
MSPTLAHYVSEARAWLERDQLVNKLSTEQGLQAFAIMGRTELQFAEERDASAEVGSLPFRAAAAHGDLGVPFSCGLFFRQSYVSKNQNDQSVHGALKFLPPTSSDGHAISSGALAAAMDEILGDVAWCVECSGFTAYLEIEHGRGIEVPVGTTLSYRGQADNITETSKNGLKCHVSGFLASIDGATIYARASAVFVRPSSIPTPSELSAMYGNFTAQAQKQIVAHAEARDLQLQRQREMQRAAALEAMSDGSGVGRYRYMTHLPSFRQQRLHWIDEECSSFGPLSLVDVPEFQGKVFLAFLNKSTDKELTGIVKFSFCAQGPPSTAHGGSRFAVLEHAATHLCHLHLAGSTACLERCKVQMKAQLPLGKTVKLLIRISDIEKTVPGGPAGYQRVKLEGALTNIEGQLVYDTVTADVTCSSQSLEKSHGTSVGAMSRM